MTRDPLDELLTAYGLRVEFQGGEVLAFDGRELVARSDCEVPEDALEDLLGKVQAQNDLVRELVMDRPQRFLGMAPAVA